MHVMFKRPMTDLENEFLAAAKPTEDLVDHDAMVDAVAKLATKHYEAGIPARDIICALLRSRIECGDGRTVSQATPAEEIDAFVDELTQEFEQEVKLFEVQPIRKQEQ